MFVWSSVSLNMVGTMHPTGANIQSMWNNLVMGMSLPPCGYNQYWCRTVHETCVQKSHRRLIFMSVLWLCRRQMNILGNILAPLPCLEIGCNEWAVDLPTLARRIEAVSHAVAVSWRTKWMTATLCPAGCKESNCKFGEIQFPFPSIVYPL